MKNLLKEVTLSCVALLACFNTIASENKNNKPGAEEEFNSVEMIMHHISDAHDFHFLDYTDSGGVEHAVSIPLPVILYTNKGLVCFMSSAFHHNDDGTYVVSKKGANFVKYHEKIYQLNDGDSSLDFDEQHHPLTAVKPIDVSITKNVFSMLLSVVLLLTLFGAAGRSARKNPGAPKGILAFLEPIIVFIREDIIIPNVGEKKYKTYIPYLITVFFFIFFNNLLGLIPGGANVTGNIAVTLVLSIFTLLVTNFSANKAYWKHIFLPPVPLALYPIMVPIEVIGVLTKPFALMIRLFANITAGHIIILSLISLIFVFKSIFIAPVSVGFVLFMYTLELLVALLQAYIFTLLSALFIGQAIEEHH
jgi:F-type H+-transporting ATPase subunit a